MPITENLSLNLVKPQTTGPLTLRDSDLKNSLFEYNISTEIQATNIVLTQYEETISNILRLNTSEEVMTLYVPIFVGENYSQVLTQLNIFSNFIQNIAYLNTVVGKPHISENPNKIILTFIQKQTFPTEIIESKIYTFDSTKIEEAPVAFIVSGTLGNLVDMYQQDVTGPRIYNLVPASGSRFNNPATDISFDIIDSEGSNIVPASINIDINGTPVIGSGTVVADPLFGTAALQKISDVRYNFNFNPTNDFNLNDGPVAVSGIAVDSAIPANSGTFSYQFYVWDVSDLFATIVGLPDVDAPELRNMDPVPLQADVIVNSNITFDIVDIHTGLNPQSVTVKIDDITVVESGVVINTSYAETSISGIEGGKRYIINPTDIFEFNSIYTISVYAEDNYSVAPNILDTTYYFFTQSNVHLEAQNLQIKNTEATYVDLSIGYSYDIVTTGIDLKVSYVNYLNEGINISGSYIKYNGDIVPFSYVSISGADYYDLYFNIVPDYTTDGELEFYVIQDTLVSGVTVFKRVYNTVLFGAQVCYDQEGRFNFSDEITIFAEVKDKGFLSSKGSLNYQFYTEPMYGNNLFAQIIGLNDRSSNILASYISNNPYHEYGKTMYLELEVSDYAGNKLYYNWDYKIGER